MRIILLLILSFSSLITSCDSEKKSWIRIGGESFVLDQAHLKSDGAPIRVVLMGDVGRGSDEQVQISELISKQNEAHPFQALILLGDNIYTDPSTDSPHYEVVSERKLFSPMSGIFNSDLPVYSILGNHDHKDGFALDQINDSRLGMNGNQYYRLSDHEGLFSFYMLDSETLRVDATQQDWLKSTLIKDQSKWQIAVLHIPPYASKVGHEGSRQLARILEKLSTPEKGFDVIISGHNHIYERREVPQLNAVALIAGASGRAADYDWPEDNNRMAFHDDEESFVVLEFTAESITGTVTSFGNIEVDQFVIPFK